ncbi:putative mitochondrial protein, partial [Mucuna pruriens]
MLHYPFHIKELGHLTYFLGLEVYYHHEGIFFKSTKIHSGFGDILDDPTLYCKLVGKLIYVTITRPNISFVVHTIIQRIIRFLLGSSKHDLFFPTNSSLNFQAYNNVDWVGCSNTRKSTIGWCMFIGNALISWKRKKQDSVSKSPIEVEYCTIFTTCSEIIWSRGLLTKLGFSQVQPIPQHAGNTSAIQIATNPVYHERTKHIKVD